jgi:apolipoprotein N-acyltransferase
LVARTPWLRALASLAGVAVSALLLAWTVPSAGNFPLAWIALVPFLVVVRLVGTRFALALAWGWCLLYAWRIAAALPSSIAEFYEQGILLGWLYSLGLWTVMAAVYYMGFAWTYRRLAAHRTGPTLPLWIAAAWTVFEFGRGRLFTGSAFFIGNPWGLIGYSQVPWTTFAQVASLTGLYGMTFAVVSLNALVAEALLGTWSKPAEIARATSLALLPAVLMLVYGLWRIESAGPPSANAMRRVSVIQGNLDNALRWNPDRYGLNISTYVNATSSAVRAWNPSLVIWPESAVTVFLEEEPGWRRFIAEGLGDRASLLTGAIRREELTGARAEERFFNSVYLITGAGALAGRYDKQYLIPFSEYFPLPQLDVLRRRFGAARVFSAGVKTSPLETPIGRIGVLTCNEAMLPEVAARRVAEGATVLVSPSNDGWIRDEKFANHMLAIVSLRAIEQGRWLVRASTSGPSAIIDPLGRIVDQTAFLEQATLAGQVESLHGRTPYGRFGDAFAAACAVAVVAGLLASTLRWRCR